jgi:1-acyl-sn-glycerol-3-phosphate acyltransferase
MAHTEPVVYRYARFEVRSPAELARVAIGAPLFLKAAAPVLRAAARSGEVRGTALRWWSATLIRYLGITVRLDGIDPAALDAGPYIVAPLHEGFADALVLQRLGLDLTFLARDELFDWPELGPYLRASRQILIPTDLNRRALMRAVGDAQAAIGRGESVVVFPQGSILGVETAFTRGAFSLAERFSVPLLPVVIGGTHRVWEHPFSDRLRFGCEVAMTVLTPVPPTEAMARRREVEREMKRIALSPGRPSPRRYVPARDGYWDGYHFEIDPDFGEVAADVRAHRLELGNNTRGGSNTP